MGLLEQIAADVAEMKSMLASGAAAPAATESKPAAKATTKKTDPKPAAPTFTAEELRDKFLAVQAKHGDAAAKQLIADCGYDKLAKLIADAANWQKSWDAAEAKLAEDAAEEADDSGL